MLAAYFVVVSATGAVLVFRIHLQRLAFPHLFAASDGPTAAPGVVLNALRTAYPDATVAGIDAPTTQRPTYLGYVARQGAFVTVLMDPVDGRILGELPEQSWVRWLQELHYNLLAGRFGRSVNGGGAIALLLMCVTGIVASWPARGQIRRTFTVALSRGWTRALFDSHRAVGIWSLALMVMWCVTGLYFAFPASIRSAVDAVSPLTRPQVPKVQPIPSGMPQLSWDALLERAQHELPMGYIARVVVPSTTGASFQVFISKQQPTVAGATLEGVRLDPYTGRRIDPPVETGVSVGDTIIASMGPLHTASFGSMPVKVLWAIVGLAPLVLVVTGVTTWVGRRLRRRRALMAAAATSALAMFATVQAGAQTTGYSWVLPPRVAPPRVPAEHPMTPARIELGRHLFYDTRLSGNGTQSCATCHRQELAFTDARAQAIGSTGMRHERSAMSLINTAYRDALTWANPSHRVLEEQVLVPMLGTTPVELGMSGTEARIYADLSVTARCKQLLAAAYGGEVVLSRERVAEALSAFIRSIVSFRSPFDRYRQLEDDSALSAAQVRGMVLFFSNSKARCGNCHRGLNLDAGTKDVNTPATEVDVFQFHNTGLYNVAGAVSYPASDTGLHMVSNRPADVGRFRVPTLRNIAVAAPYMHDGSIATLDGVLEHYVRGGRTDNPMKTTALRPLTLSASERSDLLAFLDALTDTAALTDARWSNPWP